MNKDANEEEGCGLVGPETIVLHAVSRRGPLARAGELLELRPARVRFTNTTTAPLTLSGATIDPPHLDSAGTTVEAALAATEVAGQALAPGETVTLALHGRVPARAGLYRSALRIVVADRASSATPVELRVAASPLWGFACLLLGLLLAGLGHVLDRESDVRRKLHEALQLRQEVHATIEQVPAPLVASLEVDEFERPLDHAIALLGQPSRWSFVDRRLADAAPALSAAQAQADKLRASAAPAALGAADLTKLDQRWAELRATFAALAPQFPTSSVPGDTFASRLDAYDAWAAQRILGPSLGYFGLVFPYDLARVRLLYAAGRNEGAANQANTMRRGLQRGADLVREQAERLAFFRQTSANNLTTEQRLRQRLATGPLAPEQRAALTQALDEATALLRPPYDWPLRGRVNQRIEELETEWFRAAQEIALAAAAAAQAREETEDSIDPIQAIVAEGATLPRGDDGKILPEAKFAWLQRVAAGWRTRLASFPEPNPPALLAAVEAFEQAIAARNLDDITTRLHTLIDQWRCYSTDRALAMVGQAVSPIWVHLRESLFVELEVARQGLHTLGAHPQQQEWENMLEALRLKAVATPETAAQMNLTTIEELVDLSEAVQALANQISSATWDRAALSPSARRRLADELGDTLTPATLQNLRGIGRVLRIGISTPEEERYAGRELRLQLTNMDPLWTNGVQLHLDFGDGDTQTLNAEELARGCGFVHTYPRPGVYRLQARATPATGAPQVELGASALPAPMLRIADSPVSAAARWADALLNLRCGLALLIAVALYFWRFQATATTFGASALDYAQAFSLGFAASLAVNALPSAVAGLFA
jgi:hypothetical protein